jgi:cobaltochelatase CobN
MHLLRTETRTLDETAEAVDLGQSPGDVVFLSFTDSDLAAVGAAWDADPSLPSLRVASLARLKHPYSVDLYVENVARHARVVLVRLLGGLDYWRYGVEELAAAARRDGFALAVVPGDYRADERLDAASTLPKDDLARLWGWFHEGGPDNIASALAFVSTLAGHEKPWREPAPMPPMQVVAAHGRTGAADAPRALLVFYRSLLAAADTAPVAALADALGARGFAVDSVAVSSLKDPGAAEALAGHLAVQRPDVIVNTTAFSGRSDGGSCVLDAADAPVLQAMLAGAREEDWSAAPRGLGAADLAMNVVLPEIDGRIVTRAVSFKAEAPARPELQHPRLEHRPHAPGVSAVADLAIAWARLRRTPRGERRLAMVLSDYPARGGRSGYAVGLDTPHSVVAMAADLAASGFTTHGLPDPAALMEHLTHGEPESVLDLAAYRAGFARLDEAFQRSVEAGWGQPDEDPDCRDGAFRFRIVRAGHLVVALQPDRGRAADRKADYHDGSRPPRHGYVAFYLWLREHEALHALVHCGTHGTLEWLPGKAVALAPDCAPQAVLGPVPVIYPFIVNNPGEAAQARRRIGAVVVGHLTPPLVEAGNHGAAAEVEALFDEYAEAQSLDPRRARILAKAILERAGETGLATEAGLDPDLDPEEALQRLDGWLCDLKELRIGDGLHVFGRGHSMASDDCARDPASLEGTDETSRLFAACPTAETEGLAAALDGRFVQPGPAGAPTRGRLDVMPTGRNLFGVDPRAVPTRTAWEIGRRTAEEVVARHAQDHGDWPKRIVVDLWGSATMRTGGDDLAQALALIGVRPVWDAASTRVSGFEILPCATWGRPRVDVALRISGLFRDVFPGAITLFDEAVRAVAGLDEPEDDNPLAAARTAASADEAPARIFGAAPGSYGLGLGEKLDAGDWAGRDELADAYLAASGYAYGQGRDGEAAHDAFRAVVAGADALVHVQDLEGQDILDSDAFAEHEGGFAAAAHRLGATPAVYHVDATRPERTTVRTAREEVARVLRGRATNPRWIEGQMRHGHRGAAEIAQTVDNLVAWAALADAVDDRQFELMFEATCGNERVRAFLQEANADAARAIARRFDEAMRRGLWHARSNSAGAVLADMMETRA